MKLIFQKHHLLSSIVAVTLQSLLVVTLCHVGSGFVTLSPPSRLLQKLPACFNQQKQHHSKRLNVVSKTNQQKSGSACALEDIEKIYAISDLHMDKIQNLQWLSSQQNTNDGTANTHNIPGPNDALIVAGDISHELSVLHKTLSTIVEKFQCKVFFVFGNHEAWVGGSEMDALGIKTSLEKIERVKGVCNELGVYTDYQLVGENQQCPVWIVPIEG